MGQMDAALKTFFSSPRFAVAGASSDPAKFGNRLLVWYLQHSLPVTPINPSSAEITTSVSDPIKAVASPSALAEGASEYALSVVTPPKVTRKLLEEAKSIGIRAVFLQPGTYDSEILAYARKEWPDAAIAGEDVPGTRGGEGWCVLVDGDNGLKLAGRKPGRL